MIDATSLLASPVTLEMAPTRRRRQFPVRVAVLCLRGLSNGPQCSLVDEESVHEPVQVSV